MKTIRILIAASDEMHDENLKFSELITNLNEVLEPRGIELERVKWNPETDGSIDEFKASLIDCEMCLTLYWKSLVANSDVELDAAYQELKNGNNPQKLYVFFKEPSEDIADALRDFKANFENKYGHFFCRFENADTMNLHFILQFEAYNNQINSDLVKVTDGKVLVGDREMVNLDNVPFAAMNKEYQRLKREKVEVELECSEARKKYLANPESEELEEEYDSLKSKRKNVAEESERYQKHLYNIALTIVKTGEEEYTEQMRLARELFEKGEAAAADEIFDLDKIMDEDNQDEQLVEQLQQKRVQRIKTFVQAAAYAMGNGERTLADRFKKACIAYENAISIAKKINYEDEEICKILFSYAYLLQEFNKLENASTLYEKILSICQKHKNDDNLKFRIVFADASGNIASIFGDCGLLDKSYEKYKDSLSVYKELAIEAADEFLPEVARIQSNLGNWASKMGKFDDAVEYFKGALCIYIDLNKTNTDKFLPDIARVLDNLASLYVNNQKYEKAEDLYSAAHEIRYKLAKEYPNIYLPDLANTILNLGSYYLCVKRFEEAEINAKIALDYYRMFAKKNPDKYSECVAYGILLLSRIQAERGAYNDSEEGYIDAWSIYKSLINNNPDKYLLYVVKTLQGLSQLQIHLKHYSLVIDAINNTLISYQNIFHSVSNAFAPNLMRLKMELATMLDYAGFFQEAIDNWHEVLIYYDDLSKENADFLSDKAIALNNLAIALWHNKQYKDAETYFVDAWILFKKLAKKDPDKYNSHAHTTLSNLTAMNKSRSSLWRLGAYIGEKIITPICNIFNIKRNN